MSDSKYVITRMLNMLNEQFERDIRDVAPPSPMTYSECVAVGAGERELMDVLLDFDAKMIDHGRAFNLACNRYMNGIKLIITFLRNLQLSAHNYLDETTEPIPADSFSLVSEECKERITYLIKHDLKLRQKTIAEEKL